MKTINRELKDYIEQQILPIYENNDSGHSIEHIQYVVKRSLRFASQLDRKSTRLNSSHKVESRMPSSA